MYRLPAKLPEKQTKHPRYPRWFRMICAWWNGVFIIQKLRSTQKYCFSCRKLGFWKQHFNNRGFCRECFDYQYEINIEKLEFKTKQCNREIKILEAKLMAILDKLRDEEMKPNTHGGGYA